MERSHARSVLNVTDWNLLPTPGASRDDDTYIPLGLYLLLWFECSLPHLSSGTTFPTSSTKAMFSFKPAFLALSCAALSALAAPFTPELGKRIVVDPKITSPTASTVWTVGENVTVTW